MDLSRSKRLGGQFQLHLVFAPLMLAFEIREVLQECEQVHALDFSFRGVTVLAYVDDELLAAHLLSGDQVVQIDHGLTKLEQDC